MSDPSEQWIKQGRLGRQGSVKDRWPHNQNKDTTGDSGTSGVVKVPADPKWGRSEHRHGEGAGTPSSDPKLHPQSHSRPGVPHAPTPSSSSSYHRKDAGKKEDAPRQSQTQTDDSGARYVSAARRHSEDVLSRTSGAKERDARGGEIRRSGSPNVLPDKLNPQSGGALHQPASSGTSTSWSHRPHGGNGHSGHSHTNPHDHTQSSSHPPSHPRVHSGKPSTGPIKPVVIKHSGRQRSGSTHSDDGGTQLSFEDGQRGRMRDDEDDNVLVSIIPSKSDAHHGEASRDPEKSISQQSRVSVQSTDYRKSHDTGKGVEQSSVARERESKVQSSQESEDRLRRENDRETQTPPQVEGHESGNFSSGERMPSGRGIIAHPQQPDSMNRDKFLPKENEDSFPFHQYKHALSKSSSSGSTHADSFEEREKRRTDLSERLRIAEEDARKLKKEKEKLEHKLKEAKMAAANVDETEVRMTEHTARLSVAEEDARKLKKENEKLERKLKEAELVAAQAYIAGAEVSRLDAERTENMQTIAKLERQNKGLKARSVSPEQPDGATSLLLSQQLDLVKGKLQWEMEARVQVESELHSLKQSLVVSGKGEIVGRNSIVADLQEKVQVLEQELKKKESESKRQNQVQARTISSLQTKLNAERGEKQGILSAKTSQFSEGSSAPSDQDGEEIVGLKRELALKEKELTAMRAERETLTHSSATTSETSSSPTAALKEKDRTITQLTGQLQQFEKVVRDVAKISQHSKQQSENVLALKGELQQTQDSLTEKEAALQSGEKEVERLRSQRIQFDNQLRKLDADLAHRNQQVEQLSHKVADHNEAMSKLRADLDSEVARKTELESSLDRTTKEKNHWQQKSVQQDMVIQTTRQDVDRLHREVNSLNSTVAAQGKEVERLQRENQILQGDIETHRLTAMTYKEDFESERKDRESIHARIADMETRYRHQAESLAEQLQKKADELQRHKDMLANTEELLQKQQQQMLAQIRQKEDELQLAFHQKQQLQEDVMSKTQQVKQYKKQIDQLGTEVATYREQAEVHKSQIEFYAQKTEHLAKQKTLKQLQERKLVELEGQCDQLRAENNELRIKLRGGMQQLASGSADSSRSRPPMIMKSQTMGGAPKSQADNRMQALPTPHVLHHHAPPTGQSYDDERLRNRQAGSSTNYQTPRSNYATAPPPNSQFQGTAPYAPANQMPEMMDRSPSTQDQRGGASHIRPGNLASRQGVAPQANKPLYCNLQVLREDLPYSSLPSSNLGALAQQYHQQRSTYAQDDSSLRSPSDVVEKDSPPNSNIGQPAQQPQYPQPRRAHSHMHIMPNAETAQRLPQAWPGVQSVRQPPRDQFYPPQPPTSNRSSSTLPTNAMGQQRLAGQSQPRIGSQPHHPHTGGSIRPPFIPDASLRANPRPSFSTPVEETRRFSHQKPQLGGYVKPQQASSHPMSAAGHLAVDPLAGRSRNDATSGPAGTAVGPPGQGPISPSPSTSDISKDIDVDIKQAASQIKAEERVVVEGRDDGTGIPFDPNLVCPKCKMRFREGEIQKFRRHVSSAHK